jgi:hypothetical protein
MGPQGQAYRAEVAGCVLEIAGEGKYTTAGNMRNKYIAVDYKSRQVYKNAWYNLLNTGVLGCVMCGGNHCKRS